MKKIIISLVLVVCIVFSATVCNVSATVKMKNYRIVLYPKCKKQFLSIKGMSHKMTIKDVKSSNKKVCKAKWIKDYRKTIANNDEIVVFPKKVGKSVITANVYSGKKMIKRIKSKISFYKYKNPFKKLVIGKKNYAKKINKSYSLYLNKKRGKKFLLNIKLKKGFKLKVIYYCDFPSEKKIKNNSRVKTTNNSDYNCFCIDVYNKKHKAKESYYINLN